MVMNLLTTSEHQHGGAIQNGESFLCHITLHTMHFNGTQNWMNGNNITHYRKTDKDQYKKQGNNEG